MMKTSDKRWVLTGIMSWGFACDSRTYSFFTNAGLFYDWIEGHVRSSEELQYEIFY